VFASTPSADSDCPVHGVSLGGQPEGQSVGAKAFGIRNALAKRRRVSAPDRVLQEGHHTLEALLEHFHASGCRSQSEGIHELRLKLGPADIGVWWVLSQTGLHSVKDGGSSTAALGWEGADVTAQECDLGCKRIQVGGRRPCVGCRELGSRLQRGRQLPSQDLAAFLDRRAVDWRGVGEDKPC